ncbi:MAG: hypothetical protein R3D01_12835 [Hyphomicrobiales bacterium]
MCRDGRRPRTGVVYVSPRSGRAVSREAAPLAWRQAAGAAGVPAGRRRALTDADIAAGFALTGFFLERDVLEPHGMKLPSSRDRLLDLLSQPARRLSASLRCAKREIWENAHLRLICKGRSSPST